MNIWLKFVAIGCITITLTQLVFWVFESDSTRELMMFPVFVLIAFVAMAFDKED